MIRLAIAWCLLSGTSRSLLYAELDRTIFGHFALSYAELTLYDHYKVNTGGTVSEYDDLSFNHCLRLYESPGGNQVDGLPPA